MKDGVNYMEIIVISLLNLEPYVSAMTVLRSFIIINLISRTSAASHSVSSAEIAPGQTTGNNVIYKWLGSRSDAVDGI